MSQREFEQAVREAVQGIPPSLRGRLDGVSIDVEDRPSHAMAADMGVDDPAELLGAYIGTPLTERSVDDPPGVGDRIVLYQRNIEEVCESRAELVEEIRVTVLHEIGHHFGLDEDDLDERGYG